ncbi:hypothetical protein AB0E81_00680 [Streptomyces sp. NPDC033538]|uniref:hypothetical protein n=1 Tax=Streptomyces sp. NPDC033538 TaxID=3155367 RepID=UPI0033F99A5C
MSETATQGKTDDRTNRHCFMVSEQPEGRGPLAPAMSRPPSGRALSATKAITDLRTALQAGRGLPGDLESFEADLKRALEASSEMDLKAVAAVIVDYRGRIRLHQDPDFDIAVQEGIDLAMRLKQEARGE